MEPQHSCGTLESRIKIFGCTVQELYITFYPLDHYPLLYRTFVSLISPSQMGGKYKGNLIRA